MYLLSSHGIQLCDLIRNSVQSMCNWILRMERTKLEKGISNGKRG